jgi:hypothetical protein
MRTENVHTGCCGKTTVWMFGNEIQRVTGRKDDHEVEDLFVILVVLTKKLIGLLKDQENSTKTQLSTKIIILEN